MKHALENIEFSQERCADCKQKNKRSFFCEQENEGKKSFLKRCQFTPCFENETFTRIHVTEFNFYGTAWYFVCGYHKEEKHFLPLSALSPMLNMYKNFDDLQKKLNYVAIEEKWELDWSI